MTEFDISCEECELEDGSVGINAKLSAELIEVNVWFTAAEARETREILKLEMEAPGLPLGRSAGSQVFWARDAEDHLYVLIGEGDTMWDIGIRIPNLTVCQMVETVADLSGRIKFK